MTFITRVSMILLMGLLFVACSPSEPDSQKQQQQDDDFAENTAKTPVSVSGANLIFSVDETVDPGTVEGFIVGYPGQLIVEPLASVDSSSRTFIIPDVPTGLHDLIITAGSLAIEGTSGKLTSDKDRGIRLNDIEFSTGSNKDLRTVTIHKIGTIRGTAKLEGRKEHAGIRVTIDGTHWVSYTDKNGAYSIPEVAVGEQRDIRFHFDSFKDFVLDQATIKSAAETTIETVTLKPSEGPSGSIKLLKSFGVVSTSSANLSVNVIVDASDNAVFIRSGASPDLSASSWMPIQRTFEFKFKAQYGDTSYKFYYQFKDEDGIDSAVAFEAIELPALPPLLGNNYQGCLSKLPLSTSQIRISFEIPDAAEELLVYRNGVKVFGRERSQTGGQFIDQGLSQGSTYTYTCSARVKSIEVMGSKSLEATTLVTESPVFYGIGSAVALDAHQAKVRWGPPSGVPARLFKIFGNPGFTVDWQAEPLSTIEAGLFEATLTGLGDQVDYSFGVLACSTPTICDQNRAVMSLRTPDDGAPQTQGITSIRQENGQIILQAPWTHAEGAVAKRFVYRKTGGLQSSELADYQVDTIVPASSSFQVPQEIARSNISENNSYHYVLVDEDSQGQRRLNMNPLSIQILDLTPPLFNGISSLTAGTDAEHEIIAGFSSLIGQGLDPTGVSEYLVYRSDSGNGHPVSTTPADPCSLLGNSFVSRIDGRALQGAQSRSLTLTQLEPRKKYRVCIKARDQAGNISQTVNSLSIITQDRTAPSFDGLTSLTYDGTSHRLLLGWNPSPSTDVSAYKVQLWKNSLTPDGSAVTLTLNAKAYPGSTTVSTAQFALSDSDVVYAAAEACDDADTFGNTSANCTSGAQKSLKSVYLPDTTAPFFTGISSALSLVEGMANLAWTLPSNISDFAGFKIYAYDSNSITPLKTVVCSGGQCPTSTTLTGLAPAMLYRFHVRAYDDYGNYSILDPASSHQAVTILDSTPPAFSSGIGLQKALQSSSVSLSWSAATDNQASGSISYELYRRVDSSFANASTPYADGTMVYSGNALSFSNTGLLSDKNYFYNLCAKDGSNNRICGGSQDVLVFRTDDLTPPVAAITGSPAPASEVQTAQLNLTISCNESCASYRYKIVTSTTACALDSMYSSERNINLPIADDTSSTHHGTNVVCVIGKDNAGNWQDASTATKRIFTSDNNSPLITGESVSRGGSRSARLLWTNMDSEGDQQGNLIVRSSAPLTWTPTRLTSYTAMQVVQAANEVQGQAKVEVVYAGATKSMHLDWNANFANNESVYYKIYAYDEKFNYGASNELNVVVKKIAWKSVVPSPLSSKSETGLCLLDSDDYLYCSILSRIALALAQGRLKGDTNDANAYSLAAVSAANGQPLVRISSNRFRSVAYWFGSWFDSIELCGVSQDYRLYCWGELKTPLVPANLSNSNSINGLTEILPGQFFTKIVTTRNDSSGLFTCALEKDTGKLYCWGSSAFTGTQLNSPTLISTSSTFEDIWPIFGGSVGNSGAGGGFCGLSGGSVKCFGAINTSLLSQHDSACISSIAARTNVPVNQPIVLDFPSTVTDIGSSPAAAGIVFSTESHGLYAGGFHNLSNPFQITPSSANSFCKVQAVTSNISFSRILTNLYSDYTTSTWNDPTSDLNTMSFSCGKERGSNKLYCWGGRFNSAMGTQSSGPQLLSDSQGNAIRADGDIFHIPFSSYTTLLINPTTDFNLCWIHIGTIQCMGKLPLKRLLVPDSGENATKIYPATYTNSVYNFNDFEINNMY